MNEIFFLYMIIFLLGAQRKKINVAMQKCVQYSNKMMMWWWFGCCGDDDEEKKGFTLISFSFMLFFCKVMHNR